MFHIRKTLFLMSLMAAVTLSGCSVPAADTSVSQSQADTGVPIPSVSQAVEPDVSVAEPTVPPSVPEPEPVAPPAGSEPESTTPPAPPEPEPCKHTTTSTVTVQAATCTAQGHTNAVCTACGEVTASGTISPLGHDYKTTVVDAACETPGSRTNTCSRCGDTQTEAIAAPGHSWSKVTCGTAPTCSVCGTTSPTVTDHSWVVKYAMGKPECEHCGTKYSFDKLVVKSNMLDVPILSGTKSITIIEMNYEVRSFEGSFNTQSTCRLDITVEGIASNACTLTRGSHLIAEDGTKITSVYDNHSTTNPVCDGSFTEMFSFDIPSCEGTYTVVFSAQ